jgi:hypothetical protein
LADLPYIQQRAEVSITGQDSTGDQVNYVTADANGNMAVKDYADGATGAAVPPVSTQVAGSDGTDLRTLHTDTSGNPYVNLQDGNSTPVTLGQKAAASSLPVVTQSDAQPASINITAEDTASVSTIIANNQVAVTGTPTTGSAAAFTLASWTSIAVQVSGTWTGTLVAEVSMDAGTTWYAVGLKQTSTAVISNNFTANFEGIVNVGSKTNFRVRSTTAWTGTATVRVSETINVTSVTISNPISLLDGSKATYSAGFLGVASATTATDLFTITGSATKVIRILRLYISGTQNSPGPGNILLIKRSTANAGGTSTTATNTPYDSQNPAGAATVRAYTANPTTLGTSVGNVAAAKIFITATSGSGGADGLDATKTFEFGFGPDQAIVLRGATQVLAINLNSITYAGSAFDFFVEWTEE